jgi:hypothetical protein
MSVKALKVSTNRNCVVCQRTYVCRGYLTWTADGVCIYTFKAVATYGRRRKRKVVDGVGHPECFAQHPLPSSAEYLAGLENHYFKTHTHTH